MWRACQRRARASDRARRRSRSRPRLGDRLGELEVARHGLGVPVASTNRHGASGNEVPEYALTAATIQASISSTPRHAGAGADDRRRRAHAASTSEAIRSATACSGIGCRRTRQLRDHRQCPLRADEEPGQVVAGRGLARAAAGADDAAVREHRLEREHVRAHLPVAHRGRARRIRRRHPAERRIGPRIDREEEAVLARPRVRARAG